MSFDYLLGCNSFRGWGGGVAGWVWDCCPLFCPGGEKSQLFSKALAVITLVGVLLCARSL